MENKDPKPSDGKDQSEAHKDPIDLQSGSVHANDTQSEGARNEQHEQVDKALEERNKANEEGHKKNMERAERDAQAAQENKTHVPTGKENNRNTPRIDKDGNKHWD